MKTNVTITKENVLAEIKQGLIEQGLFDSVISEITKELDNKPLKVQLTFYYRLAGLTVEDIGTLLSVHKSTVSREYIDKGLSKIKKILLERTSK